VNHQALSSFIWSVADLLRGDYKQSEYGRVIRNRPRLCENVAMDILHALMQGGRA